MIENLTIDCDPIFVSTSRGLLFESYPSNADIYVTLSGGGVPIYTGMKTPDTIRNLPIGDYDYILKKEGYYDYTDTVTVSLGTTTVIAGLVPVPSSTPTLIATAAAVSIFGIILVSPTESVLPITTGILGGEKVSVKVK